MGRVPEEDGARGLRSHGRISLAVLSTKGKTSLTGVAGSLVDIAIGVQAADTAPAQGLRDAFAECDAFVDALITRWHRLEPLLQEAPAARPNRP